MNTYSKTELYYIYNLIIKFNKNRNLHKYEKKLLDSKRDRKIKDLSNLKVNNNDEYLSLEEFTVAIKKCYNKQLPLNYLLSHIDKFDNSSITNFDIFYKEKFWILKELRDKIK